MNTIIKMLFFFFAIVFTIVLQLAALYILPYPFSKVNIVFLLLIILLMVWESGWVVWLSFLAHFIIELFSLTSFGIVLFSSTLSTLLVYWLYKHMFTNRSWITAVVLCVCALVMYRVFYSICMLISVVLGGTAGISIGTLLLPFGWELFFTTLTMAVCYVMLTLLSRRFHLTA